MFSRQLSTAAWQQLAFRGNVAYFRKALSQTRQGSFRCKHPPVTAFPLAYESLLHAVAFQAIDHFCRSVPTCRRRKVRSLGVASEPAPLPWPALQREAATGFCLMLAIASSLLTTSLVAAVGQRPALVSICALYRSSKLHLTQCLAMQPLRLCATTDKTVLRFAHLGCVQRREQARQCSTAARRRDTSRWSRDLSDVLLEPEVSVLSAFLPNSLRQKSL